MIKKIICLSLFSAALWGVSASNERINDTAGRELFAKATDSQWTYQIATFRDKANLVRFLETTKLRDNVCVYQTQEGLYTIFYGLFSTPVEAREALKAMPDVIVTHQPQLRSIGKIRQKCQPAPVEVKSQPSPLDMAQTPSATVSQPPLPQRSAEIIQNLPLPAVADVEKGKVYQSGYLLYESGKYQEAYEIFHRLYEQNSDHPKVNFYLGRCATELGLYDEALAAFERVKIVDPSHIRSDVEMGRVYFQMGDNEQSQRVLNDAVTQPIPDDVKGQIYKLLEAIKLRMRNYRLDGMMALGIGYDTNVKNDIGDKVYNAGVFANLQGNPPQKDASATQMVSMTHTYPLQTRGLIWQSSAFVYNQTYHNIRESDILYAQLTSGVKYMTSWGHEISLIPLAEQLYFGGDPLMEGVGINLKYGVPLGQTALFEYSAGVKRQLYNESHKGMNVDVFDTATTLKTRIASSGVASLTLAGAQHDPSSQGRTDASITSRSAKVDVMMPVVGTTVSSGMMFKTMHYNDQDMIYGESRDDFSKSWTLSVSRPVLRDMTVSGSFYRLINDSNFPSNAYQKSTYSMMLSKPF